MRLPPRSSNQPWPQAFQAILASQGLSAQEMAGGIIRVDAPSALAVLDSLEPLETSVVRINYGKAKDLTKSIEGILTKGRGKVIADDNSNSLIITDTRSRIGQSDRLRAAASISGPRRSRSRPRSCSSTGPTSSSWASSTTWATSNQFFNKLVQRPDPTTGQTYEPDVNIIDLGGNAVSAIGNATARSSAPRSTWSSPPRWAASP